MMSVETTMSVGLGSFSGLPVYQCCILNFMKNKKSKRWGGLAHFITLIWKCYSSKLSKRGSIFGFIANFREENQKEDFISGDGGIKVLESFKISFLDFLPNVH